jgi:hypothetical protein
VITQRVPTALGQTDPMRRAERIGSRRAVDRFCLERGLSCLTSREVRYDHWRSKNRAKAPAPLIARGSPPGPHHKRALDAQSTPGATLGASLNLYLPQRTVFDGCTKGTAARSLVLDVAVARAARRSRACCSRACAASGQAVAPPMSEMNSRRFIRLPDELQQAFVSCGIGFRVTPCAPTILRGRCRPGVIFDRSSRFCQPVDVRFVPR